MDTIKNCLERSKFFREIHTLPLSDEFNYKGWIENFSQEEQIIAAKLVDFFLYYPKSMVCQMLRSAVGRAGYIFSSLFDDWQHENFRNMCYYSFIPGETNSSADSGYLFSRKIRDELGVPEKQLINFSDLFGLLESSSQPLPIILVDDFVGSGLQCENAWNTIEGGRKSQSISDIVKNNNHKIIYAPLIINSKGRKHIEQHCKGLILSPTHILGDEYNIFDKNCYCWDDDESIFSKGVDLILRKSKELEIPFTEGQRVIDAKGFAEQGLALSFEHGAPDAIPAIFYWKENNWTPLINKNYCI